MRGDVGKFGLDKVNKDVDGVGIYACAFVAAGVEDGGADIAGQRVCLWGWWFGGIVLVVVPAVFALPSPCRSPSPSYRTPSNSATAIERHHHCRR